MTTATPAAAAEEAEGNSGGWWTGEPPQNDPRAAQPRPGLLGKPCGQAHAGWPACARVPESRFARRPPAPITPLILRQTCSLEAAPPQAPGTHLVSDITSIPTCEGWLYLAVVIDLFSRAIFGWKLSDSLHTEVVTGALRRALDTGLIAADALFHSDRGCQYSAILTRQLLARHGLRQSMSAAGYCYDNAFAESAFASLKSELPDDGLPFASKAAASTAVFDYLESFSNRKRRHSSLAYLALHTFLDRYFQSLNSSLN